MTTETQTQPTEVKVLSSFDVNKADLAVFIADYTNLVVTPETFEEAKKARLAIREKRYAIQNQQKKNDDARILWNKSSKESNDKNAKELIAILEPVELEIDKGIKVIEEAKEAVKQAKLQAEKELRESRAKLILATGAQFTGNTYFLTQEYVDLEELTNLSDKDFDKVLAGFTNAAKIIQDAKDAEAKRISDEEAAKEADRLAAEAKLKAEQEALAEAKRIQEEKEAAFAAEQKRITEEAFNKRLSAEKEIADKEAKVAAERKQVEADKKALVDAKIKQRKTALFALGMAIIGNNFIFHQCELYLESVTDSTDEEFASALERVTAEITIIKARLDLERQRKIDDDKKAIEESEAAARRKAQALLPDKEKLHDFVKSLLQVTGPEVQSEEARGIIEIAISQLRDTAKFIEISIAEMCDEIPAQ